MTTIWDQLETLKTAKPDEQLQADIEELEDRIGDAENTLDELRGELEKLRSRAEKTPEMTAEEAAAVKAAEYRAGPIVTRESLERWKAAVADWKPAATAQE